MSVRYVARAADDYNIHQGWRHGATIRGGGGREPFDVDSFHATPIGIMLNAAGDRYPIPPPPPPGAAAHDIHILCTTRQRAGHERMTPSNMTNDGTARAHLTESD